MGKYAIFRFSTKHLCQKFLKSNNACSSYSEKCRGCFFETQCISGQCVTHVGAWFFVLKYMTNSVMSRLPGLPAIYKKHCNTCCNTCCDLQMYIWIAQSLGLLGQCSMQSNNFNVLKFTKISKDIRRRTTRVIGSRMYVLLPRRPSALAGSR